MKPRTYTVEFLGDWRMNQFCPTIRERGPGWVFSSDSLDHFSPLDRDVFVAMMCKGLTYTKSLDFVYRITLPAEDIIYTRGSAADCG